MHLRTLWFPSPPRPRFSVPRENLGPGNWGAREAESPWQRTWEREGYLKRETSTAEAACPFKGPGQLCGGSSSPQA